MEQGPGSVSSILASSFSPDAEWLAFYAREATGERADLYVVRVDGSKPRLLLEGGLPETRRGPRWAPNGKGLFAVLEQADGMNPLMWVPLQEGAKPVRISTDTELNADPYPYKMGDDLVLLFAAQGAKGKKLKRWRGLYLALLRSEPGK